MKSFKKITAVLISAAMMFAFSGCSGSDSSSELSSEKSSGSSAITESDNLSRNDDGTITVVDHAGNTVTVPSEIDKIVVCDIYPLPSVLSVFFDSADKIAGMAAPSMAAAKNSLLSQLYPEILEAKTDFIDGTSINIEEVIALDPDVVFYSAGTTEIYDELTNAGIPAVGISASKWDYDAIETLNNWLDLLGQIFPENAKTEVCSSYSKEIYDMVQQRVSGLSDSEKARAFFLFQYSDASITTSGKMFFGQWWAEAIGAVNVGGELETDNSTQVNMEQIYDWNPDIIFMTNFNTFQPSDIYGNSVGSYDWSAISAVENKQVYKMPLGMYRSYTPGIDTPITLLWLAKTAYPKLFSDIDITKETKDYYKEVFGIELTDEQANSIFTPVSDAGNISAN